MIVLTPQIRVSESEFDLSYVRSSGPGGQNVNKVNSKAVLRWNVLASAAVSDPMKERLLSKLGQKLTRDGELIITSDVFRDQGRNRDACFEKLKALIASAIFEPKRRRKTQPSKSSVRKGQAAKRRHSEKKAWRRNSGRD